MAGSKRERELHRAKLARQAQEAEEAAQRRRRRLLIGGPVVAALVVVGAVGGIALANSHSSSKSTASAPATSATATPTTAATPSSSAGTQPVGAVTCVAPSKTPPGKAQYTAAQATAASLLPTGTYTEKLTTNCGVMQFTLDSKAAPTTTKAFTFLSDRGFFDHTNCHRLTTAGLYVIQCGDPLGNGTGGPGFKIAEENLPKAGSDGSAVYQQGTVAMANAGPGTTGSQFFIVYKDSPLPPDYTVLGSVTQGLNIAEYVASKGTRNGSTDGAPKQPLQITKMISSVTYPAN